MIENNTPADGSGQSGEAVSKLQGMVIPGLDMIKGVKRFIDDEDAYIYILRTYAVNTRNTLAFFDSINKENIVEYETKIHSMRGSSASICADSLAGKATALETAAIKGDWDYILEHNRSFVDEARALVTNIENLMISLDSRSQKPEKDKPDPEVLEKLKAACESYDMDEVDAAMEELTGYNYKSDDGLVVWLQESIDLMNFSEVVERLSGGQ